MLDYDFMRHAFLACAIVGALSGAVGWFLVLRGQSFAGHALGHIGFAGATGAALIGAAPFWGLIGMTLLGGIGMGLLGERAGQRDVAIGVVLALALGLGLLFLHFYTGYAGTAMALLFGNVLGVSAGALARMAVLAALALAALAGLARPLIAASLQPELAEARGVRVGAVGVGFLAIAAVAVAESAQIVGVLLVFALLIAPAATAQRLTARIGWGVALAAAIAIAEAWGGLIAAYLTDWPATFWIAAFGALGYLAAARGGG
ncbi:MAG: metal ABC transporter permease [Rhodospirillales bacterium]|nr:metal ABC transporter permease [Rhodospirillales bacterium]